MYTPDELTIENTLVKLESYSHFVALNTKRLKDDYDQVKSLTEMDKEI